MLMQFISALPYNAAIPRAVACMDIGLRPEGLCFGDDRKLCRSFEILIREESIDVRGCLVMTLVRDCFGVTRSLSFSASALELVSCDILPGAAAVECAEVGLFVTASDPLMLGNNAKRWL